MPRPPFGCPALLFAFLAALHASGPVVSLRADETGADTPPFAREEPLILDPFQVSGDDVDDPAFDPTGLGGADAERIEPPFGNDLLRDIGADEMDFGELDSQLAALAFSGSDAAEVAVGGESLNLRGFPTPRRFDGFSASGLPEVLNAERSETISGSLVSVVGRAAPGGIQNSITNRPRGRVSRSLDASASTLGRYDASARASGVVVPKKSWYQSSLSTSYRDGPQRYATLSHTKASAALAFRHTRATSTLWRLDAADTRGNPAPGIPQYRATPGGPLLGAYLPLAGFHTHGPRASVANQGLSLGFQLESALNPDLALSSGTQLYRRDTAQDRFTTGQFIESTGKFSGVREPTRSWSLYEGVAHQTDLVRRLDAFGAAHKLRLGAEGSLARSHDESRGIIAAERPLYLPADVLTFDPEAPNYFRPAYSESVYARVITDREVRLAYAALSADTRSAFARGRTVFTTGIRFNLSDVAVADRRPDAASPDSSRVNEAFSFHLGLNQRVGKTLLLFANTSSAVQPSTRVDSRTGAIQRNETTSGFELGARTILLGRKLSLSAIAYRYVNTDIARRNPLYNDPVFDEDQTQPQLVSSGEEEFRGLTFQTGWKPAPGWTATARATWQEAITVSSPDLPEEEGRPLARIPEFSASAGLNRSFTAGRLRGFSVGASATHVGDVVQTYARPDRIQIEFPAYTLLGLRAGYTWPVAKTTHSVSLSVANVLDTDLLARSSRLDAERSLTAGYRVTF